MPELWTLGITVTPSRAQYFFARVWLLNAWLLGVSLISVVVAIRISGFTMAALRDWSSFLWLVGIILISGLLGFFLAFLSGWFIFGPLYFDRGRKNGAPFTVGDRVHILVGVHRDAVVRVYEVWESRNQVRVELGDQEKKSVTDVFSYYQICREHDA